jgi:SAM-dependent methyltransferase
VTDSHERRPTHRFSHRVADYARHRPSYPPSLLAWLGETIGFTPSWRIADIGSGTGIFSRLLIEHGNGVHAVEPNDEMRAEAEASLGHLAGFTSVAGTAERTTLPDHAFEMVTAAQAFHWFETDGAREEFHRILVPGGRVLVVFNTRRIDASPFMKAYEALLRTSSADYTDVDHRLSIERVREFLVEIREWRAEFTVRHAGDGILALTASASYAPAPGHPRHNAFYAALRALFDAHQANGMVEVLYETEVFLGTLRR